MAFHNDDVRGSRMLDSGELAELGVIDWPRIAERFRGADLLLGNGFSLSLAGHFSYSSLFQEFLEACDGADCEILEGFETNSFELILGKLGTAQSVNQIMGIDTSEIERLADIVKNGLALAIHSNHPTKEYIDWGQLERIALSLQAFGDIFTLNYDLFLYHMVMLLTDKHRQDRTIRGYSDYFWGGYGPDFQLFMERQDYPEYKLVHYLHGALFIFSESYGTTLKVKKSGDDELLGAIADAIDGWGVPLFVAEGESREKMEAINRNRYLQFALERLKSSQNRLVVFGASLSPPDQHIVNAINANNRELAVGIHVGDKDGNQVRREKLRVESIFSNHSVRCFDSDTLFDLGTSED